VIYLPKWAGDSLSAHGTTVLKETQALYGHFKTKFVDSVIARSRERKRILRSKPETEDEIIDGINKVLLFYVLAFMKPYDSDLPPDHIDYFYSEREWRLASHLWFTPADVTSVIVSTAEYGRELGDADAFSAYRDRIHVLREEDTPVASWPARPPCDDITRHAAHRYRYFFGAQCPAARFVQDES
jgi:hypothetical protein